MSPKHLKYRELVRDLREFDPRFQVLKRRGKGSHRMLYHPDIGGRAVSYPLVYHGDDTEIGAPYLKDIVRRFKLPAGVV